MSMVRVNGKRKTVRLSPVLTLLSCNGSICVLAFSLSSGLDPLKEFDIAVPAVRKNTETLLCLVFSCRIALSI